MSSFPAGVGELAGSQCLRGHLSKLGWKLEGTGGEFLSSQVMELRGHRSGRKRSLPLANVLSVWEANLVTTGVLRKHSVGTQLFLPLTPMGQNDRKLSDVAESWKQT